MYSPINNILAIKGEISQPTFDTINNLIDNVETRQSKPRIKREYDPNAKVNYFFYETNGEPLEELARLIQRMFSPCEVYFASVDYDGHAWKYCKRIGKNEEERKLTCIDSLVPSAFKEFVENED
jgi:predicted adenine nucleotide alpha hydrolase (AANH) superfamily ATPase